VEKQSTLKWYKTVKEKNFMGWPYGSEAEILTMVDCLQTRIDVAW